MKDRYWKTQDKGLGLETLDEGLGLETLVKGPGLESLDEEKKPDVTAVLENGG
jgi:hypothetical protein